MKKGEAVAILEAEGIEAICARIECGESQAEIARSYRIDPSSLSHWINRDEYAQRSARAREMSAEAWLDRGLAAIEAALDRESGKDASAARAYAQECARRAAVRNPRYVERAAHEVSGPGGKPIELTHTVSASTLALLAELSGIGADSCTATPVQD